MKGVAPPLTSDSDDSIPRFRSSTIVVNSKSARHAVTGFAFVIKISA